MGLARTLLLVELASVLARMPLVAGVIDYDRRWGSVQFDLSDLLYFAIGLGLLLGRERSADASDDARGGLPYLRLWLLLGALRTLAYAASPLSNQYLTDPIRAGWQFYRYCWRPLLLYPLGWVLLGDQGGRRTAMRLLVATACVTAVEGIAQGYAGLNAYGPFTTKNQFGGFLVIPTVVSFVLAFAGPRVAPWWTLAFLVLLRTLVFTSSRGAFVACTFGFALAVLGLWRSPATRGRAVRLVCCGAVAGLLLLGVRSDLFERDNVKALLSATQPLEVDNVQWRFERWQFVWEQIQEHPWLGSWSDNHLELGETTNTSHNGYLAMASISGLPSVAVLLALMALALRAATRAYRDAGSDDDRVAALATLAALAAVLLHNLDDSTLTLPFVGRAVWLLAAWAHMRPVGAPVAESAGDEGESVHVVPRGAVAAAGGRP